MWMGYAVPTVAPTAAPSISFTPTQRPTLQAGIVMQFNSLASFSGFTENYLENATKSTVAAAVCTAMQIDITTCHYLSSTFTEVPSSNAHQYKEVQAVTYDVVVTITTVLNLIDFPEFAADPFALYEALTNGLILSGSNGEFAQIIKDLAQANNMDAPQLLSAIFALVNVEDPEIQRPPTFRPTAGPPYQLKPGEIAGITIGVIIVAAALLACCYFGLIFYRDQRSAFAGRDLYLESLQSQQARHAELSVRFEHIHIDVAADEPNNQSWEIAGLEGGGIAGLQRMQSAEDMDLAI